jgi:hypothetical protein
VTFLNFNINATNQAGLGISLITLTSIQNRFITTMYREKLPITALPAWSKLNDVNFLDSKVSDLGGSKGFGLVTERALNSKDTFDIPTLLTVPLDLILSAEAVEEHAKADHHFRQLLDAVGGKVCTGPSEPQHVHLIRLKTLADRKVVSERRCDVVPSDASHNWIT